ncbi:MAG TPA: PsbP-related protein [Syntrophomonadaceae bacterium]|nr:PsbP-related protein [Syntrophomonadaceae bacterium]
MECPICQAEIPDGAKFCYDCGNKIKNSEASMESKPEDKAESDLQVKANIIEGWAIEPQAKQGRPIWKVLLAAFLIVLGASGVFLYHSRNSILINADPDNIKQQQWTSYSNEELGIAFSYPLEWKTVDPTKNKSGILIFMAAAPNSSTSIYLTMQSSDTYDFSAEELANATVEDYKSVEGKSVKDYKKIAYSSLDIGNYKAGFLDSEFTFFPNGQTVRNRQLFVPTGQKSYFLNMTTEKSNWNKNEPIFTEIIKSFKFIPK